MRDFLVRAPSYPATEELLIAKQIDKVEAGYNCKSLEDFPLQGLGTGAIDRSEFVVGADLRIDLQKFRDMYARLDAKGTNAATKRSAAEFIKKSKEQRNAELAQQTADLRGLLENSAPDADILKFLAGKPGVLVDVVDELRPDFVEQHPELCVTRKRTKAKWNAELAQQTATQQAELDKQKAAQKAEQKATLEKTRIELIDMHDQEQVDPEQRKVLRAVVEKLIIGTGAGRGSNIT